MNADSAHPAVWLDIPRSTRLRGTFTADWDIHLRFGEPDDEVNVVFDRSALARLVEVADHLLAVPAPAKRAKIR